MTTPEQEREQLAGVYSGMSDEELRRVANSGDELTPIAQEVLNAEMARRGAQLAIAPQREAGPSDPNLPVGADLPDAEAVEFSQTVTLQTFRDLPQALLAKGSLESAGIQSYVIDDNIVRMDWFISNSVGGIKLQVHPEDVEASTAILNQHIPETLQVDGVGEYKQPQCPKCQSLEVSYRERLRSLLTGSSVVAWACGACGHEWDGNDDGVESKAESLKPESS